MPGPYPFQQIFAADPNNTENVAKGGEVLIFAPGDQSKTPLVLTDLSSGMTLPNPITVNANGFGPAFLADLDQVAWEGGGFEDTFESYRGMKDEAVAARMAADEAQLAAEAAASLAMAPTADVIDAVLTDPESAASQTIAAATAEAVSAAVEPLALKPDNGGKPVGKGELVINVKDAPYNAVGDGVADDTAAINAALSAGAREVFAPAGTYLVSGEIKVPSKTKFRGAGIDITTIFMRAGVRADVNTVTNAGNTRLSRATYDDTIVIQDMTIDSNGWSRDVGSALDQGCGIKLSTVKKFRISNVRSINGILHCIDVAASIYQDSTTSNVNTIVPGPSLAGVIENCVAEDSVRDDGITVHGSGDITIDKCRSIRTVPVATSTQQGIEIDEGCYRVSVRDCYTFGWVAGYQAKGHDTTTPAYDISFTDCVADSCNIGFTVEHVDPANIPGGQTSWARNVFLTNCSVINGRQNSANYPELLSLRIRAYENVVVRNFVVRDSIHGNITIDRGARNIKFDGLYGYGCWTSPDVTKGFIHAFTAVGVGPITISNMKISNPIATPAVRASASATSVSVDGLDVTGTSNAQYVIWRQALNVTESYKHFAQTGFGGELFINAGTRAGSYSGVSLDKNFLANYSGAGTPEGSRAAYPGSFYINTSGGTQTFWVKQTGNGNTGWVAK